MEKLKTVEIMYKAFNNSLPNNKEKLFVLCDPIYMTRQNCVFKQRYARTNLKTMCISINGVTLWNSLDSSLFQSKSVHLFKNSYTVQEFHSYVTNDYPDYGEKINVIAVELFMYFSLKKITNILRTEMYNTRITVLFSITYK